LVRYRHTIKDDVSCHSLYQAAFPYNGIRCIHRYFGHISPQLTQPQPEMTMRQNYFGSFLHRFTFVCSLLFGIPPVVDSQEVSCHDDAPCERLIGIRSKCQTNNLCSNPFQSGCLYATNETLFSKRVCNSEDAGSTAHCRINRAAPDYPEIRLYASNWESSTIESWVLQIVLSELLGVPTTIESGDKNRNLNFYHPNNNLIYGTNEELPALTLASQVVDCRLTEAPCAHFSPEGWDSSTRWTQDHIYNHSIERPLPLGVLAEEAWFITKHTAVKDPTLTSYLGFQHQREKLADLFLRPTTFGDFCNEVSIDNCTSRTNSTIRGPKNKEEASRMFLPGVYTGYFRKTIENDCKRHPDNCTGHIGDYPCGWSSWVQAQTFHLNISLASSGDEPYSRGYTSQQLQDMWMAANATKANLIMYWWRPEPLYQQFVGTDFEFQRVLLAPPTQDCAEARLSPNDRCSPIETVRLGSLAGACDEPPKQLDKFSSTGLHRLIFSESIPEAIRNPAWETLQSFQLSGLQLDELLRYARTKRTTREAVCTWAIENIEFLKTLRPRTYPRVLQHGTNEKLDMTSSALASLAIVAVLATFGLVHRFRTKRSIRTAQLEFLWLLLTGLGLVAVGSFTMSLSVSTGSCIASTWLVNLGYTVALVPLLVKISAINRLNSAARSFRRVVLPRKQLFRTVLIICAIDVVYLTIWTAVDTPLRQAEYVLTDQRTTDDETIVHVGFYCTSRSFGWTYGVIGWQCLIMVAASVLAFQTRDVQKDFNESHTLAMMIYSHVLFVILRAICGLLIGTVRNAILGRLLCLVFSFDTLATLCIYFVPKLIQSNENNASSQFHPAASDFANPQRQASTSTTESNTAPRNESQPTVDNAVVYEDCPERS
jgi:7 transmembrane sweet-taste receptor of 3 GCPR